MNVAYLDGFSGISGDMTLGALVHLGVPLLWLQERIQALPLSGFELAAETVTRSGIQAVRVSVRVEEDHHHRGLGDIEQIITQSSLSASVKAKSLSVFHRLADAEAKVHGCAKSEVHFHEVGAVDAIVDIVGACLGFEYLGIQTIMASPLPMGRGFVECAHGVLPVPAPATLEILKGAPVYGVDVPIELVTPTGAAIAVGLAEGFSALPDFRLKAMGYGAGTREVPDRPNLLRIILGTPAPSGTCREASLCEKLMVVETCIDDMNPELFGYLMETLFADGALDVFWVPVQMKKSRPGTWVQVLCPHLRHAAVVERLFAETTTLGVRSHEVLRTALARDTVEVATEFGMVRAKKVWGLDGSTRIVPEYEECRLIAERAKVPLKAVYDTILFADRSHL